MRYAEILEAAADRRISNTTEKQKRAREQLASADEKRADAARRYQDQLRSAQSAAQRARAKLRSSSVSEAGDAALTETRKAYALRNKNGSLIGWLEPVGRILQARDRNGIVVGWYDPRQNHTRNAAGTLVGTGDLLSALLICKCRR